MRVFSFIFFSLALHAGLYFKFNEQNPSPQSIVSTSTSLAPQNAGGTIELIAAPQIVVNDVQVSPEEADTDSRIIIKEPTPEVPKPKTSRPANKIKNKHAVIATKLPPKINSEPIKIESNTNSTDAATSVVVSELPTSSTSVQAPNDAIIIRDGRDLVQAEGNTAPEYPAVDRKNKQEGTTVLVGYVTSQGSINEIKIEKASGSKTLDASSFKAFANYKFLPGQEGWIRMPFKFELKGASQPLHGLLRTASAGQ